MPVNAQASSELDPEMSTTAASDAGSRNTPEPIMFPATSAVDIHVPRSRFSSGACAAVGTEASLRAFHDDPSLHGASVPPTVHAGSPDGRARSGEGPATWGTLCGRLSARALMGGGGGTGSSRMRASTTTAPRSSTITGFRSISAISGCASTIAPTRSSELLERRDVRLGGPPVPVEQRERARASGPSRATSRSVIGVMRTATSFSSSAAVPPAPQATTGPNTGSWTTPDEHLDSRP